MSKGRIIVEQSGSDDIVVEFDVQTEEQALVVAIDPGQIKVHSKIEPKVTVT